MVGQPFPPDRLDWGRLEQQPVEARQQRAEEGEEQRSAGAENRQVRVAISHPELNVSAGGNVGRFIVS